MNINATLLGQMITFGLLVWFTMKYIWPPLAKAMADRQKQIADGFAAAKRGQRELQLAEKRGVEILRETKAKAAEAINQAEKRAGEITHEAKQQAKTQAERILVDARGDIEQEMNRAREELRRQVAALAVAGAEQILRREIDAKAHQDVLDELAAQL